MGSRKQLERDFLRNWLMRRLEIPFEEPEPGPDNVTALFYCFGTCQWISSHYPFFLSALRQVWSCCGMLKTVCVANEETTDLSNLKAAFPKWVEVQIAEDLVAEPYPDDIISMSLDMNANLANRFNTDYVLIFQDDGFPLRPGLVSFLGKCDFYGAPLREPSWFGWIKGVWTGDWRANGGFSLRSRRLVEAGNLLFKSEFSMSPYNPSLTEDLFFTGLCPRVSIGYRRRFSIAKGKEARCFSFEGSKRWDPKAQKGIPPFGFHSPHGFAYCYKNRLLPDNLLFPGFEPP